MDSRTLLLELKQKIESGDDILVDCGLVDGKIVVKSISCRGEKIIDFHRIMRDKMRRYLPGINLDC